jgi:hypothetical protein
LVSAALAVVVTGLLRWAGVPREDAWHGGTGYLLLTAVTWYLWLVRRRLRARMKPKPIPGEHSWPKVSSATGPHLVSVSTAAPSLVADQNDQRGHALPRRLQAAIDPHGRTTETTCRL